MPNAPRTQHRSVRVDDDTWATFGTAAISQGGRGSVIRRLLHLYLTDRDVRKRVAAHGDDLARDRTAILAGRTE